MNISSKSFVTQIPALSWVESYTVTDSGIPIISWNGTSGVLLHSLCADGTLEPLCPFDTPNQVTPVAYGERIAFFAEDPSCGNDLRLYIYDLGTKQLICPAVAASARPRSIAWLDKDHLVTVDPSDDHADLVLVATNGEKIPRKLLTLPGGVRWLNPSPSIGSNGHILLLIRSEQVQHIARYDPKSGSMSILLRGSKSALPLAASWSPSSSQAVCLVRRSKKLDAVLLNLASGAMQTLDVPPLKDLPIWHSDDKQLLLTLDDWPATRLALYDVATRHLTAFPSLQELMTVHPSYHDGRCYFIAYAPDYPPALWYWEEVSGRTAPITPSFALPRLPLPEILALPSPQGFNIPCLYFEAIAGKSIQGTVLMLHGGPSACWRIGWDPVVLSFAEAGYRVVLVNTRGSNFRSWPLPPISPGAFGSVEVDDLNACVEQLQCLGITCSDKIAIYGHSHGAFIAYQFASRFPEKISAVILTSGYLQPSDLLHSQDPEVHHFLDYAFDVTMRQSDPNKPIEVPCPLLIVHGEHDSQIPAHVIVANEERLRGKEHQLLILHGDGHAYRRKVNIVRWIEASLTFLKSHVEDKKGSFHEV